MRYLTILLLFTLGHSQDYSLSFNGENQYIEFASSIIPTSGDFTVQCWAKGFEASDYREILSQREFYIGYTNQPQQKIRVGDNWSSTEINYPFDEWHKFTVVKTSTNTQLYIDGILVSSLGSAISNPSQNTLLKLQSNMIGMMNIG